MKKAVIVIIFLILTINLYAVPDSYEIEEILFLDRLGRLMDSEGPFVFSTGFDFVKSYVGMHVLMLGRYETEYLTYGLLLGFTGMKQFDNEKTWNKPFFQEEKNKSASYSFGATLDTILGGLVAGASIGYKTGDFSDPDADPAVTTGEEKENDIPLFYRPFFKYNFDRRFFILKSAIKTKDQNLKDIAYYTVKTGFRLFNIFEFTPYLASNKLEGLSQNETEYTGDDKQSAIEISQTGLKQIFYFTSKKYYSEEEFAIGYIAIDIENTYIKNDIPGQKMDLNKSLKEKSNYTYRLEFIFPAIKEIELPLYFSSCYNRELGSGYGVGLGVYVPEMELRFVYRWNDILHDPVYDREAGKRFEFYLRMATGP